MLNWNELPKPIIALSPMADMTDSAFCLTVKSLASPILFREMVSSEAIIRENEKTLDMASFVDSERPIVQQIFGADPDTMAKAAAIVEKVHAPDGIDINMGCPVYKLISNFNGAALMKDPELAAEIIRKVKAAVSVPVSVKIRAGWSDPLDCIEFAKVVEEAGADLITVHGRTKEQAYSGYSDWDVIKKVKEVVSIPVLANGDVFTPEDVAKAIEVTGCDGVLIARGGLGNPWIFSRTEEMLRTGVVPPPPTLDERIRVLLEHAERHVAQYGERGIVTFRKHLSWYLKGVPGVKEFRQKLHTVDSLDELRESLKELANAAPGDEPIQETTPPHHPYKSNSAPKPQSRKA